MTLRRQLGLVTVLAIVIGNMIGSGIFFTPGELAQFAASERQVYFIWTLCGAITLCGALTLAEIATLLPRPGVFHHALTEAYGPFAGFLQGWIQILVTGPGAIAGIAVLFGELTSQVFGFGSASARLGWGVAAIVFFVLINLRGVTWGGRTQVLLTAVKLSGLALLVAGGLYFAPPTIVETAAAPEGSPDWGALARFVGLGVAIVFFTYDGWIDATHVAGEVRDPGRTFPRAMTIGIATIIVTYLVVNYAFLRVVPLPAMQADPGAVAGTVARAAFGARGEAAVNVLMGISIFGALGGLVMTLPRLCYATATDHLDAALRTPLGPMFRGLTHVPPKSSVPAGATIFIGALAIAALLFFGSFSRIVTFLLVPLQAISILLISTVFVLRPRLTTPESFKAPFYPWIPIAYMVVVAALLLSAVVANPLDTAIGIGLSALALPAYLLLRSRA